MIARFEAERQALAMMDHPNIAKVLDAGTTEAGRPYFVMELVKRRSDHAVLRPVTTCNRRGSGWNCYFATSATRFNMRTRKGIIHRDVKPTNVLDCRCKTGRPVPKIIDFGVAKAIESTADREHTLMTGFMPDGGHRRCT